MHFHIVTLFPSAFKSYLGESILKRAIKDRKIGVSFYNPRDFADNKWKRIDRPPYGGGPGLVIEALPVIKAVESALKSISKKSKKSQTKKVKIILLSPNGRQFTNGYAEKISKKYKDIILISGRYEGVDARVKKVLSAKNRTSSSEKIEEVSVGPYVLTGGELPAMITIDAIARQITGVLGNPDSVEERRVSTSEVYTRPEIFTYKGTKYRVPKILLSGHRAKIEEWKEKRG